jgi:FkbH-like protein
MKTLRGTDRVKLIIVDLDDTMWRGTAAEMDLSDEIHWDIFEAYPIAFVEALLYFKKRGGILAVCSKNDREATLIRWAKIYRGAITPEDFACVKINWNSKAENIAEILRETNLLPESVVFIDDNPREVDAVRQRFPTLRCLSQDHIDWRRIILRAPEMLVDSITEESRRRTEMTQALVARTESKSAMSDAEWLLSLNIKQEIHFIRSPSDSRYRRVLELINKTNQFNTTGKRWEPAEFEQFVLENTCIATSLSDRTTNNGIIGVALVRGAEIVQVVLSCRVFGMGAEQVLGAIAVREALTNSPAATGRIVDTGKNFTCHKYFTDLQFAKSSDEIFEGRIVPPFPNWIEVREDLSETN